MAEVPTFGFDPHFARVPGIVEVDFNPERCAVLLTHPNIGIRSENLARLNIYVRPDYKLGYTREERRAIRRAKPDDYDDAASCGFVESGDPLGKPGEVLITLVYGSGFGVNELLCHEGIHARELLQQTWTEGLRSDFRNAFLPARAALLEAAEEAEADRAMKDLTLKGLRKGVITVIRNK